MTVKGKSFLAGFDWLIILKEELFVFVVVLVVSTVNFFPTASNAS